MQMVANWLPVVAAALFDRAGRMLLQQRGEDRHHGGLWEFPGGKVESGEHPRQALARELEEELGLCMSEDELRPVLLADDGADGRVTLLLYSGLIEGRVPQSRDGQAFGWYSRAEAYALPLAPMDRDLLTRLDIAKS